MFFLSGLRTHAFINIESLRHDEEKGFNGAFDFSLAGQSGNVERNTLKTKSFNKYLNQKNEFLIIGSYSYGESGGARDLNSGYSHVRYTRLTTGLVYLEIFNQLQFSEFQRLDLRVLNGFGARFKMLRRKEQLSLYSGLGVFYEIENLRNLEDNENYRLNGYISLVAKPNDKLTFTFTTYSQPLIEDFSDLRLQSNFGFSDKITDKISLGLIVLYSFDSDPPEEVKKADFSYKVSLNFKY